MGQHKQYELIKIVRNRIITVESHSHLDLIEGNSAQLCLTALKVLAL